ncbi:hypothetical protein GW17_00026150 [Ensete ventricosum]|nr:hypothetical protein GW17_00026150 [Ensete ventricosum]
MGSYHLVSEQRFSASRDNFHATAIFNTEINTQPADLQSHTSSLLRCNCVSSLFRRSSTSAGTAAFIPSSRMIFPSSQPCLLTASRKPTTALHCPGQDRQCHPAAVTRSYPRDCSEHRSCLEPRPSIASFPSSRTIILVLGTVVTPLRHQPPLQFHIHLPPQPPSTSIDPSFLFPILLLPTSLAAPPLKTALPASSSNSVPSRPEISRSMSRC